MTVQSAILAIFQQWNVNVILFVVMEYFNALRHVMMGQMILKDVFSDVNLAQM